MLKLIYTYVSGQIIIGGQISGQATITSGDFIISSNSVMTLKGIIDVNTFRLLDMELDISANDELISSSISDISIDDGLSNIITISGDKLDIIDLFNVNYAESSDGYVTTPVGLSLPLVDVNTTTVTPVERVVTGGVSQTTIKN